MTPQIRDALITLITVTGHGRSIEYDDGVRDALLAVGFTREQIAALNEEAEARRIAPAPMTWERAA